MAYLSAWFIHTLFTRRNQSQSLPHLPHLSTRHQFKSRGKDSRLTAGDVISGDARLRLIFADESTELGVIGREEINDCFPVLVLYSTKEKV